MKEKTEQKTVYFILGSFLLSRVLLYGIYGAHTGQWGAQAFIKQINIWDAGWYKSYAEGIFSAKLPVVGSGQAGWAFFPLYPLIVALIWHVLHCQIDPVILGSLLSSIFFVCAEWMGYRYIILTRQTKKEAYAYIAFLSFGIYSFYFSLMYTESLFLLLLTMCFYYLQEEKYIKMGICGALLSATRNVGVMFVFVVLVKCVIPYCTRKRFELKKCILENLQRERLVLGTCMIPAGLFAYMLFLTRYVGDGFAFVHVQKAWGISAGGMWDAYRRALIECFPPSYLGVFAVGSWILILISLVHYRKFHEMIYPIIVLLMSTSYRLNSVPRYMMGTFVMVLAFLDCYQARSRTVKILCWVLILSFEYMLFRAWIDHNALMT